jgi:hypothetical protein
MLNPGVIELYFLPLFRKSIPIIMSFIAFKVKGKEVIINTDRIISISHDSENGLAVIKCTDQFETIVDDSEEEIKRKLGIRNPGEGVRGFK